MTGRPGAVRAVLLSLVVALLCLPAAPAQAAERICDRGTPDSSSDAEDPDPDENPVADALQLEDAHALSRGDGIGIAVIDSGIDERAGLPVSARHTVQGEPEIQDGHGTIVGGLAAGEQGVAPGAHLVSVRVTDTVEVSDEEGESSSETKLEPEHVAAAIRWVLDPARAGLDVRVINLSLGFDHEDRAVRDAIRAAVDAGVVVVAAAGNRAEQGSEEDADAEALREQRRSHPPSEVLFPATMDDVIAVTGLNADLSMTREAMLVGPEIDVSAPIFGARTKMIGGLDCAIGDAGSSWAAPQVSGLAALLLAREPGLTPAQVKTRIEVTASGAYHDLALDGHGSVQPVEALTADLEIAGDGALTEASRPVVPPYEAARPDPPDDAVSRSRETMLWWGIGAGGLLLAALMLRPLLARRGR